MIWKHLLPYLLYCIFELLFIILPSIFVTLATVQRSEIWPLLFYNHRGCWQHHCVCVLAVFNSEIVCTLPWNLNSHQETVSGQACNPPDPHWSFLHLLVKKFYDTRYQSGVIFPRLMWGVVFAACVFLSYTNDHNWSDPLPGKPHATWQELIFTPGQIHFPGSPTPHGRK